MNGADEGPDLDGIDLLLGAVPLVCEPDDARRAPPDRKLAAHAVLPREIALAVRRAGVRARVGPPRARRLARARAPAAAAPGAHGRAEEVAEAEAARGGRGGRRGWRGLVLVGAGPCEEL